MSKKALSQLPKWTLIALSLAFIAVPLYLIVISSLKESKDVLTYPLALPTTVRFSNFSEAISQGKLLPALKNSILVSVCATFLQFLYALLVSYSLNKMRGTRLGFVLYLVVIVSMFIPGTGWVAMISLYKKLGLYNNLWGIILNIGTASLGFNVFILYGFMRTIPQEMEEAAILDGCTDQQYVTRVLIHLVKPALYSICIFAFSASWNNLMTPLLLLRDRGKYTVSLAIRIMGGDYSSSIALVFAAILMSALPILLIYLFCQKYFVEALSGSVKG